MTDKKIIIRPGGHVRVELPAGETADTAESDERRRSLIADDDDPPGYIFRARPTAVAFYDLSTRLRSVAAGTDPTPPRLRELESSDPAGPCADCFSEYAGVHTGDRGTEGEQSGQTYTLYSLDDFAAVERGLLGRRHPEAPADEGGEPLDPVDPFGFTLVNGSSRLVSDCEELSTDRLSNFALPAFRVTTSTTVREQRPEPENPLRVVYRGTLGVEVDPVAELVAGRWRTREAAPGDNDERWNPKDLESGAAQRQLAIPRDSRIRAEGQLILGQFTPQGGDDSEHPDYWDFISLAGEYHGFDTGDTVRFKVTMEPSYGAEAAVYTFRGVDNRVYLRPLRVAPEPATSVRIPVYEGDFTVLLPPGSLVAVIAQGSKVYYVWRVDEQHG